MPSRELLRIMCCPESKSPLIVEGDFLVSTHPVIRRRYRIQDGVPVMLIEESEILEEAEWQAIMRKHNVKLT